MNFKAVTISNIDERMTDKDFAPFNWKFENVQSLSFDEASFDFVFVSDGLHHCYSPHAALLWRCIESPGRASLFSRVEIVLL